MQPTPLIHIGFPKALSTWLQKRLFLPEFGFYQVLNPVLVDLLITNPTPFRYAPLAARDYATNEHSKHPDCFPVISAESLSGSIHCGGYNARQLADRIKGAFPSARILLIIREQRGVIRSIYSENIKWGMTHSLKQMLYPVGLNQMPCFNADFLNYDLLIQYYFDLYGRENVNVLAFEEFLRSPHQFVKAIFGIAGIEPKKGDQIDKFGFEQIENKKLSIFNLAIERQITRYLYKNQFNAFGFFNETPKQWLKRLKRMQARENYLPQFWRQIFEQKAELLIQLYSESKFNVSNRITSELIGKDLGVFGYHV